MGGKVSHKYKEGKFQAKWYHDQWENRDHARGNGFFWHLKFTNYNNYWQ
jgi:hypothetical protein